jgi:protein-S-isoprenylcysteine O-methyltransferase Ste14
MEDQENVGASVRFPPPFVYLGAIVMGVLLHLFVHPLPCTHAPLIRYNLALAAAILGICALGSANNLFKKSGQDPKPWKNTPEILDMGIYRFTRNPMYLGMALLQTAIGFGLGIGWILAFIFPVLIIIYLIAIRPEEAYLERKFGDRYLIYKNSVRRWI